MSWEMVVLVIVGGFLYKLKSIHIDFTGKDGNNDNDAPKQPKQIKSARRRKQLKK